MHPHIHAPHAPCTQALAAFYDRMHWSADATYVRTQLAALHGEDDACPGDDSGLAADTVHAAAAAAAAVRLKGKARTAGTFAAGGGAAAAGGAASVPGSIPATAARSVGAPPAAWGQQRAYADARAAVGGTTQAR